MPAEIARVLGTALLEFGAMMGRADASSQAGPLTTLIPAPRRSLRQIVCGVVSRQGPAEPLACTRDPADAALLLDTGWSVQHQAILVLSPDRPADAAIAALHTRVDWRDFRLVPPVTALVMPSNDGDGAMIAASSAPGLANIVQRVDHALRAAGFPVSQPDAPVR